MVIKTRFPPASLSGGYNDDNDGGKCGHECIGLRMECRHGSKVTIPGRVSQQE